MRHEVEKLLTTTFVHDTFLYSLTEVEGDGNCLFRSFSKFCLGVEEEHEFFRKKIVDFVFNNWQEYEQTIYEQFYLQGIFFNCLF